MNSIKQRCRPKHQVLVLKCYPRNSKAAVDVRPNSSELSYLLFYATSRRSKIQKIGAFLEKKTASDVWRMRIGNVQVTLGILAALLEKSPKDAVLIAPCVLKILDLILRSDDMTLIESSLPTFEAFCEHHDVSSLFGDKEYARQYGAVVRSYASLASTKSHGAGPPLTRPVQARWRSTGLKALRSVATSDALSSITGRQIDVIVPTILENLSADDDGFVDTLLRRAELDEKVELEKQSRRRMSVGTVGTADTGGDQPAAFSGSPNDDDRIVEEEIGVLAMQGLKAIFVVPNRLQIQGATVALLRFIFDRLDQGQRVVHLGEDPRHDSGWAITVFELVARWTPVQDRYIILVVAMETLLRNPLSDDKMAHQMTLVAMIGSLLRSDVNLIGLSVMDVLLGFVRHMRKLFQSAGGLRQGLDGGSETGVSLAQRRLLGRLEQCVGDLATHVYYADQISDMVEAILARIKPGRSSSMASTPQGENAEGNDAGPSASGVDLSESQSGGDFSHVGGRVCGLRVVKEILLVATLRTKRSGNMDSFSRTRVPVHVWEGTHWLLRDPDGEVRKAYVDALATWLDRETTLADSRAVDDLLARGLATKTARDFSGGHNGVSRRSASNPTHRERPPRVGQRSQFLPMLHLSVYDSALQSVDSEADIALLHALLTKLVLRLGVNSVRFGIPMIYRLQEDIQVMEQPIHKVRAAAMCHGYFWALSEKFDFEGSAVGRAILNEVARRRSKGFWVEGINVPPPLIKTMTTPGQGEDSLPSWDMETLEREELLPFDDRISLVEYIAARYEEGTHSPPASPGTSPLKHPAQPILGSASAAPGAPAAPPGVEDGQDLPGSYRDQMLSEWSRNEAAAALAAEARAESLNGSRSGMTGATLNRLTINTAGINGNGQGLMTPYGNSPRNPRPHSARFPGERDGFGPTRDPNKTSLGSGVSPSDSSAGKGGIASVDQLKMVLSGSVSAQPIARPPTEDDSGDSMASYEYSPSEASFNPVARQQRFDQAQAPPQADEAPKRSASLSRRGPLSSNPPHQSTPQLGDDDGHDGVNGDGVPPVPALPTSPTSGSLTRDGTPDYYTPAPQGFASRAGPPRKLNSRGGDSLRGDSLRGDSLRGDSLRGDSLRGDSLRGDSLRGDSLRGDSLRGDSLRGDSLRIPREWAVEDDPKAMDLQDLLMGIDSSTGEGSLGNITRPPY